MKKLFLSFIISILIGSLSAQSNYSFRFSTVVFNPLDTLNRPIYISNLTKNGLLSLEPGIYMGLELFGNDYTSVKFAQSVRLDPCFKIMTTSQIFLRYRLFKRWKNTMTISVGPVLFIRGTWKDLTGYYQQEYYQNTLYFQNSVMWFSAELEFNRHVSKHGDFVVTLTHMSPHSAGILIGYKYWMRRKAKRCGTCPGYR